MQMDASIAALLSLFEILRPVFTHPTFSNFVRLSLGWLLTPGRHAVTAALVVTGASRERHHSAFHRFFSWAKWKPDEVGRHLFVRLLRLVPEGAPVPLALDDTLTCKRGDQIFGVGCHIDAVRSTKGMRIFSFGHIWVVLAVVVHLPFCKRPWALPVLLRLYRSKKWCEEHRRCYQKKTELAREMLNVLHRWLDGRRAEVSADQAYCNHTVMRRLPKVIDVFGAMRPDAALTEQPPPRRRDKRGGRPRKRGARLPSPEKMAEDTRWGWYAMPIELYRREQFVTYKELTAQWYRAAGVRLLKIVITKLDSGRMPLRVFFCTNPTVSVDYLLRRYASRWALEVTFRDLKQLLGFADSQAWTQKAVERTAPFVAYLFTLIVLWYTESARGSALDLVPYRPWYRHKVAPSFADMLGTAQRAATLSGVFDPARNSNNLHNLILPDGRRRRREA